MNMTEGCRIKDNEKFSIDEIIDEELVDTYYQPIISMKKKKVMGFEALSRGINKGTGNHIGPHRLIGEAERFGLLLELDRLFRKGALQGFCDIHETNKNLLLSINVDNSAIEIGSGSNHLIKSVNQCKIDPENIIIEILESKVEDTHKLLQFVKTYKELGFLIAIDDFGAGYSNWERMMLLKPDLIKIDMSIIRGIEQDFYKQESARSIINLAHSTGALLVAEGVETMEEAMKCMDLNCDIFQGFFFSKPEKMSILEEKFLEKRLENAFSSLNSLRSTSLTSKKEKLKKISTISNEIIDRLKSCENYNLNDLLPQIVTKHIELECIYVLDSKGIQISRTIIDPGKSISRRNILFYPDPIYSDQSNKDYYFNLIEENEWFISEPYISLATGNMTITISKSFYDIYGEKKILCMDISEKSLRSSLI